MILLDQFRNDSALHAFPCLNLGLLKKLLVDKMIIPLTEKRDFSASVSVLHN